MIFPDRTLIASARKKYKHRPDTERGQVEDLINSYEAACKLSRGPDPKRRQHWKVQAGYLLNELRGVTRTGELEAVR